MSSPASKKLSESASSDTSFELEIIALDRLEVTHVRPLASTHCAEARIVVDKSAVKYLNIRRGVYPIKMLLDPKALLAALPPLPENTWWDYGYVKLYKDTSEDIPILERVERQDFPTIYEEENPDYQWCPKVDYADLVFLGDGTVRGAMFHGKENVIQVSAPTLGIDVAVAKLSLFPSFPPRPHSEPFVDVAKELRNEIKVYQKLVGKSLAPRIYALITENETRVMGLLMEKVEGRSAKFEDLDAIVAKLGEFHQCGYFHKDAHDENFIITKKGPVIIDFGWAQPLNSRWGDLDMQDDINQVTHVLTDLKNNKQPPKKLRSSRFYLTGPWYRYLKHECFKCKEFLSDWEIPLGPRD